MNIWENAVLTDKGTALQAKLVDGQTLHITKVVSGGAKVPVVNLRQQTNVTDGGKEITLQPVRIEGDKTILPVLLENIGLEEGYDLWQVGIYAQDPEEGEILYCLAQASEAKHIPSATEGPGFSITWDFVIKTSNTAPFEVDVNSVGLVSIEQYQVHAGEIQSLKNSIVNLDERIEDLNADLVETNGQIIKKANQTDLKSINNKLNELTSDTGWIKFSLTNGYSVGGMNAVRKVGNIVFFTMSVVKNTATNGYEKCAIIPTGFRPNYQVPLAVTLNSNLNCDAKIETDGSVMVWCENASGAWKDATATYICQ